jgi:nucleotide-binding universal stress UspA family protein
MKLLLPLDGSPRSIKTLEWAATTFPKDRSEYYLLVVIPILPDLIQVEYDVTDATKTLNNAKTTLEKLGCKVAKVAYVLGDPVNRICEYANEIQADQVVMGSHGKTGLTKLLLGSISIAVMERCKQPVIIYCNVERSPAVHAKAATSTHL